MLILLDIDGVLVTDPPWKKVATDEDGFMLFNDRSARNLIDILKAAGGDVILTSTHRISHPEEKWLEIFKSRRITVRSLEKLNQISSLAAMKSRADEILEWAQNNTTDFIIIDDDSSLEGLPAVIKKRWIKTNPLIGIDEEVKQNALGMIGKTKEDR